MAIYKCNICGAIYDEEKEERPFSELDACPASSRHPVFRLYRGKIRI